MTDQTIIEQAKLPNETLFAWTSVGDYRYYPQFVNVSRKDGRIVISVRSLEDTTGEHPRTGNQAVAALPDEEVQRLVTALQSSAVLPSEAIQTIAQVLLENIGPAITPARAADIAYTAMRAATLHIENARLSPTPETGLVEALERLGREAIDSMVNMPVGTRSQRFRIDRKEALTILERYRRNVAAALSNVSRLEDEEEGRT